MIDKVSLPDTQAQTPKNKIFLPRVGVSGVKFPISVSSKEGKEYTNTIATFDMFCDVEGTVRGTNMSRFPRELAENWLNKPLSGNNFKEFLTSLKQRQKSNDVYASASFEYILHKNSPVTNIPSVIVIPCKFIGILRGEEYSFVLEVKVAAGSYCPCSRSLALVDKIRDIGKGSHAQRSYVTVQIKCTSGMIWIEDVAELIDRNSSCPVYPILKRDDEKYVTIKGYDNAKFCEDVSRDALADLIKTFGKQSSWMKIKVENFENIHDFNAMSVVEISKNEKDEWNPSHRGSY